ncbi:hypothetical protein HanOQP8_Chr00c622g0845211 [Helianthus annuus]|nr:hypothetical protein HanOQP8_Chr00c622g0845211 [Helianthus annuus]
MGVPNWRSPGPTRTSPGTWDVFDASQLHREPKRLRTGGNTPLREMKDQGVLGPDPAYGGPTKLSNPWGGKGSTRFLTIFGEALLLRVELLFVMLVVPEVVNCSARTGLDMLAKHYTDAVGFDIVFFLPDSEEDFASYTEFVRYLGDRNRAGVAKFDDGTTLFLVPPSEFLSEVLNVSGPERLYGVVLKFPHMPLPAHPTSIY